MNKKNTCSYRVIYGDTDQMGIVYYANYLRWFEKGRSELLRRIGLPYAEIEREGFHFPVIEVTCRYHKPARYDDTVIIETELAVISRATLSFNYKIYKDNEKGPVAEGSTRHGCVNASGRLVRIPNHLAQRFKEK
ncbi:MAG: acyl-CoA thioesterase [Candidatus Binatia bacterium]